LVSGFKVLGPSWLGAAAIDDVAARITPT